MFENTYRSNLDDMNTSLKQKNEQIDAQQKQIEDLQLALAKSNTVAERLSYNLKRYQSTYGATINCGLDFTGMGIFNSFNKILKKEFIEYCENGDIDNVMVSNLDYLLGETELISCNNAAFCKGLYAATKNGHKNIVQLLTNRITNPANLKNITEYINYYEFHQACYDHDFKIVSQLLDNCTSQQEKDQMISSADYSACYAPATYVNIRLIQLLADNLSKNLLDNMATSHNYRTLELICEKDSAGKLVKLLCENMSEHSLTETMTYLSDKIHYCHHIKTQNIIISYMTDEQRKIVVQHRDLWT